MIEPYDESHLQGVSYDIKSGNYVRVFSKLNEVIDLSDNKLLSLASSEINIEFGYLMLPNDYVLVKTKEFFNIPESITAHIRPITTFSRLGLIFNGQQIQPTFSGYLYLGVFNATPNPIRICSELLIAQIVFEEIDGTVTEDLLYKNKTDAKYLNEDKFVAPNVEVPDSMREVFNKKFNEIMADLKRS